MEGTPPGVYEDERFGKYAKLIASSPYEFKLEFVFIRMKKTL
jgi:hypothetical protein